MSGLAALIYGVLGWAMSGAIARVLVGAGLTLVVYAGVGAMVEDLLEFGVSALAGLPSDALALALLSGVGEAVSIIGSALVARTALVFASNVAGLRQAS